MTPEQLSALKKRLDETAPISNAAHDCRALLAYVDQLRAVVAAADAWLAAADRASGKAAVTYDQAERLMLDCIDCGEAYRAARKQLEGM